MSSESNSHPKYRPDIDGLRAIAVLSVILFHVFPRTLSGGFAGVDVFFVISGFLISTIIFNNLDKDSFSFLDFYSRRVRRIFPSLIVVLLVSAFLGWLILLPQEMHQLGKHIASSIGFIQNFILWKESGYFDSSSEMKPLLHIWSLGIEEQFYFIWPLLLFILAKLGRRQNRKYLYLLTILGIFTVSFYLNLKSIHEDPNKTFYLPQFRFWELAIGGILAWLNLYSPLVSRWAKSNLALPKTSKNLLSATGLGALAVIFVEFDHSTVFPGINALLPVLATAFIIISGPQSFLNKHFLSHKTLVWIGLISFPLYLWHWPLLSFGRIIYSAEPPLLFKFTAVFITFLAAWLSVRFIEMPFRFGLYLKLKTNLLYVSALVTGLFGLMIFQNYAPDHPGNETQKGIRAQLEKDQENCRQKFPEWFDSNGNSCSLSGPTSSFAIIGDSHAGQLHSGLSALLNNTSENVLTFSASCAAPFLDIATALNDPKLYLRRKNNYQLINQALIYAATNPSIHTVVLAHHPNCSVGDGSALDLQNPSEENREVVLRKAIYRTLELLTSRQKNVLFTLDNPYIPFAPQKCVRTGFLADFLLKDFQCEFEDRSESRLQYNRIVLDIVNKDFPQVKILDLHSLFCKEGRCSPLQEKELMYSDPSHLSLEGSLYVAPYILKVLE